MLEPKTTLFISDLHLSAQNESLQSLFLAFLQGPALMADKIYVLGDLFDVWVGHDVQTAFHDLIASAFKALADKGIDLYFMAGNRDFLIESKFLQKAGFEKLPDPCIIQLHGKPFLLSHGDKLCTQDVAYQRYRKIAQHPITKSLFLLLPKKMRTRIAHKLRSKSQQHQSGQHKEILDVCPQTVDQMMIDYNVKYMLHGHVHRPQFHHITLCNQQAMRFVLGDWHHKASLIFCTEDKICLSTYCMNNGIEIIDSYTFEASLSCNDAPLGADIANVSLQNEFVDLA
ncbi:MAG: UDP-2,3-diacylglucosamine diphosphatase [Candidatus Berkiella sp.]